VATGQEPQGTTSLEEARELGLDRSELVGMYRNMLLSRGVEERGRILFKQGKVPGSYYTGLGNEASAVAFGTAMAPEDVGTPIQRNMAIHLVRGTEPWRILANFMGRADGLTRGREGNIHFAEFNLGLIQMVSHLPAMLPVAVGCALAFRIRNEPRVALGWFGDGASARGDAHEAMNFAGVRRLPVVFVCNNNQFAYSTPNRLEFATQTLAERAAAYGFEGVRVDGTDVLAVYREARRAIEKAREGGGPTLVETLTLRMEGHGIHDDSSYVPGELLEEYRRKDPIEQFDAWLVENAGFTDEERNEIELELKELLNDAVRLAEASPEPDPAELLDGVYASRDALDAPHFS
jgi:pyruvate dehydrogenase E1 component alpha subunit